ncbi:TonB family protein [Paraburkholderia sp. BCC1886]|uniref:TonB family protein n=1 Tax=Paraburkholderia sp. BCC1886 TaxID=2562670 RepID=UPI00118277FE|nr:TonB family protein [Paraburkholderia sp. BCC1886]
MASHALPAVPSAVSSGFPALGRRTGYGILLTVVLLHVGALAWLLWSMSTPTLVLAGGAPEPAGVRVSLVSAPAAQPVAQPSQEPRQEPKQETKPAPKPLPQKTHQAPVLAATHSDSTREVTTSTPDKSVATPPPTPAPAPAPAVTPPVPATTAAAPAGSPDKAELALPKPIGASQLKQLGCSIPAPSYPAKARRLGRQGIVNLAIAIDRTGRFSSVTVQRSSGFDDLDAAAVDAVTRGHCQPYVESGIARNVTATQPISFSLGE